jgi:hypothetical protein
MVADGRKRTVADRSSTSDPRWSSVMNPLGMFSDQTAVIDAQAEPV